VTAAGGGLGRPAGHRQPGQPVLQPGSGGNLRQCQHAGQQRVAVAGLRAAQSLRYPAVVTQALAYAFGNLDERLRYTQTVAAFNTSGDIFKGIGAGAFSMAAGFEWRQEVAHNDESYCAATDAYVPGRSTDFSIQYGSPFGGIVTVDEAYLETNLPLLKDLPFAHLLEIDAAARESRYSNKEYYGLNLDLDPGAPTTDSHDLTTWKVSGTVRAGAGCALPRQPVTRLARA
jgi:hypothetical protein